jgi:hypothetical protein
LKSLLWKGDKNGVIRLNKLFLNSHQAPVPNMPQKKGPGDPESGMYAKVMWRLIFRD